jgi:hypothetical protein
MTIESLSLGEGGAAGMKIYNPRRMYKFKEYHLLVGSTWCEIIMRNRKLRNKYVKRITYYLLHSLLQEAKPRHDEQN